MTIDVSVRFEMEFLLSLIDQLWFSDASFSSV